MLGVTMLYHLTDPRNIDSITREGLRANDDGEIYLFTELVIANTLAVNQVCLREYALFQIDPEGITGGLHKDDVAELSAPYQRIVRQDGIDPRYIQYVGTRDSVTDRPTEWDYMVGEQLFDETPEQVRTRWMMT